LAIVVKPFKSACWLSRIHHALVEQLIVLVIALPETMFLTILENTLIS
jgi:hypothetical protein